MELTKALDQISQIHEHLTKSEVSRDYRALPAALSGLVAIGAATAQPLILPGATPRQYVLYWFVVGAVGFVVAGGGILTRYLREKDTVARRQTRTVLGQLLPCLVAGVAVTVTLKGLGDGAIALLPGLWAILYSLGIFASRPYLPRAIGFVALYYIVAGTVLLILANSGDSLSPHGMACTFGPGQLLAGAVLYWNLERKPNDEKED